MVHSRVTLQRKQFTIIAMNLMTYVQRNQATPEELPGFILDYVGFAWLTYCDYGHNDQGWPRTYESLLSDLYFQSVEAFKESFFPKKSQQFFSLIGTSNRYKTAQILAYSSVRDVKKSIQFCAIATRFGDQIIIAYEGTDISKEGWEEDFMLSYQESIGSYPLAIEFYESVAKQFEGPIVLTGHSKGGNIAEYVLMQCEDDSRIIGSYSFEGPGFKNPHFFDSHPERIEKLKKIIPHGAIVGVIFDDKAETKIVKSNQVALLQHDPFSWVIKGDDFLYRKNTSRYSKFIDAVMNGWIASLSNEDIERFSGLFFSTTARLEVRDYTQFFKVLPAKLPVLYGQYRHFTPEDQAFCRKIFRSLLSNVMAAISPKRKKRR